MAWTSPATAVAGQALTAAMWNTNVRDNLLATETALATTDGQTFATTGVNTIAARTVAEATVSTSQTTTSAPFVDLATVGPAVTVTTGPTALVVVTAVISNNSVTPTPPYGGSLSYAVTGATTRTAAVVGGIANYTVARVNGQLRSSPADLCTGLTPGSNTFTVKYSSYAATGGTGTATFVDRSILVWPI